MVSSLALQIYFSVVAINQATNYKTFFSPHLPALPSMAAMVFHPHFAWPFCISLPGGKFVPALATKIRFQA
jgi:hypothetical protein